MDRLLNLQVRINKIGHLILLNLYPDTPVVYIVNKRFKTLGEIIEACHNYVAKLTTREAIILNVSLGKGSELYGIVTMWICSNKLT